MMMIIINDDVIKYILQLYILTKWTEKAPQNGDMLTILRESK